MRTDSFFAGFYAGLTRRLFAIVICLGLAANGIAQSTPGNRPADRVGQPPSPLSQYSTHIGEIGIHNPTSQVVFNQDDELIITQDVDLRETLQKYAEYKKCSLDQAFADTVAYLKMRPLGEGDGKQMIGTQAYYSIVQKDIYRITAPKKFFNRLSENLLCLENGKRYVLLDVSFVLVSPKQIESLQKYMIPGSYVAFNNKFPEVVPYATQATLKDSAKWRSQHPKSNGTFVVASETKTKIYPTFLGRLDDQNAAKLLKTIKKDANSDITLAPRMKIIPGQTATVNDAAERPFVVGVDRVEGDFTIGHQPIVQSVEDGIILKLRATGEENEIRLDSDLAVCEISSVGTFTFPNQKTKQESDVTVQVPEQKLKQVHLSTLIKQGETLLIDPVFEKVTSTNPPGKKTFGQKTQRVIVMIKPRFVDSLSATLR